MVRLMIEISCTVRIDPNNVGVNTSTCPFKIVSGDVPEAVMIHTVHLMKAHKINPKSSEPPTP